MLIKSNFILIFYRSFIKVIKQSHDIWQDENITKMYLKHLNKKIKNK